MVDNILTANAAAFDAYPTMKAFHARVAALDGVKEYMVGHLLLLPKAKHSSIPLMPTAAGTSQG